jgi:hypothetical protein
MTTAPVIPDAQLGELRELLSGSDSVELKLTVSESQQLAVARSLGMDPLDAQIRQVFFFDTPSLAFNRKGVVVRARRVQQKGGDVIVKLRPVVPAELEKRIRKASGFGVEVDAMPGSFVCSGTLKRRADNADVRQVAAGAAPLTSLLSKRQRAFATEHGPAGIELDALSMLGPILVLKLKFDHQDFARRLVAELWLYPDGSRLLELSTKCPPDEAFQTAADARAFLSGHGVDLSGEQETKTKKALRYFAKQLNEDAALDA